MILSIVKSIVGILCLTTNEELETKFEDSELPPPIPPKRLEVNYCNNERSYDHSSCTAHESNFKVFRPPPPVPLPLADSVPMLPPKTKYILYYMTICSLIER